MNQAVAKFALEFVRSGVLKNSSSSPEFVKRIDMWSELFSILSRYGQILPFLDELFRTSWKDEIPQKVIATGMERLSRERLIQEVTKQELAYLLGIVAGERFDCLLFGDADLQNRIYRSEIKRPIHKLEVLVLPEVFSSVLRVLGRAGFRIEGKETGESSGIRLRRKKRGPVVNLYRRFGRVTSDIESEQIFSRSLPGKLLGLPRSVRTLLLEDQVVYLSKRGVVEEGLRNPTFLYDIREMIKMSDQPIGPSIVSRASEWGALSSVWFSLNYLEKNYDLELNSIVKKALSRKLNLLKRKFFESELLKSQYFAEEFRKTNWKLRYKYFVSEKKTSIHRVSVSTDLNFVQRKLKEERVIEEPA